MAKVLPVFSSLSASVFLSGHLACAFRLWCNVAGSASGIRFNDGPTTHVIAQAKGRKLLHHFVSLPITVTAYVFGLLIAGADVGDTSEWQGT